MNLRFRQVENTAPGLQLAIMRFLIRRPEDFAGVFDAMARDRPDGVFVVTGGLTRLKEGALFEFARSQKLPTRFETPISVRDGGLIGYMANHGSARVLPKRG